MVVKLEKMVSSSPASSRNGCSTCVGSEYGSALAPYHSAKVVGSAGGGGAAGSAAAAPAGAMVDDSLLACYVTDSH